jgi:hypothetical protein
VVTGPSGYGRLSVTGAVSLPDNSGIEVLTRDAAGCAAIPAGTTLSSVLSSSTSLSLGNVWVSDDCDHMNFRAVRNGLVVNLVSELPVQAACGDAVNHASTFVPTQNLPARHGQRGQQRQPLELELPGHARGQRRGVHGAQCQHRRQRQPQRPGPRRPQQPARQQQRLGGRPKLQGLHLDQ